jgi:hypothetical protein
MYASPAPRSRSVWADLDALVLEEVNALRTDPPAAAEAPAFASEEDFVACVAAYLRGHDGREALLERVSALLVPDEPARDADPGEESAGAPPDEPDPAPRPAGEEEPGQ